MNAGEHRTMDPFAVLGIGKDADGATVRAAYLKKVKECPPDRDAEAFERIRDAYALLRDPKVRLQRSLFSGDPKEPLTTLLKELQPPRAFLGPRPWLDALQEGS